MALGISSWAVSFLVLLVAVALVSWTTYRIAQIADPEMRSNPLMGLPYPFSPANEIPYAPITRVSPKERYLTSGRTTFTTAKSLTSEKSTSTTTKYSKSGRTTSTAAENSTSERITSTIAQTIRTKPIADHRIKDKVIENITKPVTQMNSSANATSNATSTTATVTWIPPNRTFDKRSFMTPAMRIK